MKRAQSADGVVHEFPDGTPDEVVDRAMKDYSTKNIDPMMQQPAQSGFQYYAKDIGKGALRGGAEGLEQLTTAGPAILDKAGELVETATGHPEQTAERRSRMEALAKVRGRSPSEFVKEHVGAPETEPGKFTESVLEAAPSVLLQRGGPITRAATTVGIGGGGYAGEKVAEELDLPPAAGRFVGSVLGGTVAGGGAQLTAEMRARRYLPTAEQTRNYSQGMYRLVEQHGLQIEPTEVQNFAAGLRADLDRVYMTDLGGRTGYTAAERIEHANGDLAVIMDEYRNLGNVRPNAGPNYASAQIARDHIIEWIGNLQQNQVRSGDPAFISDAWRQARDGWRVSARLENIDRVLESGEWRRLASGQGFNLNTARQQIRKILDNDNQVRRFTPEERTAMARIVEGGLAENVLRMISTVAPHGSVSALPGLLVGIGTHDTMWGLGVAAAGWAAHLGHMGLQQHTIAQLRDVIREASPQITGAQRRARAALMTPGKVSTATARGVLSSGAGSPLAAEGPQE